MTIAKAFPCYFSTGNATYKEVTADVGPFLLSAPSWRASQGLIIERTDLNAVIGPVGWESWLVA